MTESTFLALLGEHKDSSVVKSFIQSVGDTYEYDEIDDDLYYEFKKLGFALNCRQNRVSAVFLYGTKEESFEIYKGEIPFGVKFEWSREKVREQMGQPTKSGHAKAFKTLPESIWDRYDFKELLMNITYSSEDCLSIKRITLMPSNSM
jgi:hypothetical protein